MKKRLLALFMVLVLCMTMVLTGCKDNNKTGDSTTPKDTEVTLNGSIEKTFNAMLSADAGPAAVMENALNKGKVTIALGEQLKNVLYLDSSSKAFANNLSFNEGGQSVNIGIYGKDKEFAIAAPELLGDTVYGINLETLATDLKDSAIWSLMGTDYDTFMSEYSELIEQITSLLEGMDEEAVNEMADELVESISETLKDVEVTTKEEEVEIYGEKVKATVITYHMEKADIEKLMDVMIDWMEEMMTGIMDEMGDIIGESVTIEGGSSEDVFEQLRAEIDTGLDGVEIEGDFYAYINSKTQYLMQMGIELTATVEGETGVIDVAFVLGKDPTKSDKFAFVMDVESDGEKRTMEVSLSIDEKTEGDVKTTTFTLAADMDGEKQEIVLAFAHDQKKNEYKVSLNAEDTEVSLSGKLEITDSKFHFTIDEVEADDETMSLGLAITVEVGAEGMPAMPAYTNILKLSEDELTSLLELMGQVAPDLPAPDYPDYPDYTPQPGDPDWDKPSEEHKVGVGSFANGPVTVYDENGVEVIFTELSKDRYGDYRLAYEITNNTKGNISFSTDNCSINGITMNMFIFEEVGAGATVTGDEIFYAEELSAMGITEIRNIKCYDGEIMDTKDYDYKYAVGFELDCGDLDYVEKVDLSGDVIYDANGIKLINKGVIADGHGDASVVFLLVNNRDDHIAIEIDDVFANGVETDKFGYAYAYAGTAGYYDSFWFESDLKDVGGKLESLSFVMEIEGMLDYNEIAENIKVSVTF